MVIFSLMLQFVGCTIERAQEQVVENHVNGVKKTSFWVYPDGEILKRNDWYNNGIKEFEIPYKNGRPHGKFKRWTVMGDLSLVGEYRDGLRHGKWTGFFTNKKKESVRHYKNDRAIGDWMGWHFNGEVAFEEHYDDNGDSIGIWKKFDNHGRTIEENSCHSKNENGFIAYYYDNGTLQRKAKCRYGILEGERITYANDTGNSKILIEHFRNGVLHGARDFYSSTTSHTNRTQHPYKHEHWNMGIRDSAWTWKIGDTDNFAKSWFKNGTGIAYGHCEDNLSILCAETSFVDNVPGGLLEKTASNAVYTQASLWYKKNGHNLRYEEIWENGKIKESRSFYPDTTGNSIYYRQLASEGYWDNGKRNGIWRNWYRNGILRDSLTYINGERIGEQFSYDSTGQMTIHKTENGKNKPIIMHLIQQKK